MTLERDVFTPMLIRESSGTRQRIVGREGALGSPRRSGCETAYPRRKVIVA